MADQATRINTELLPGDDPGSLTRAAALLQQGELVAVPTETVYGLAANAADPIAVAKIFAAKGRPSQHPLITHIAGIEQLEQWAREVPAWLLQGLTQLWPGPLTVVLPKQAWVSEVITGGHDSIGLRVPAQPLLRQLLQQSGLAVAAPSANRYQQLSPTTAAHVMAGLQGRIAAVLDGGQCSLGTESTIIRPLLQANGSVANSIEVLRPGPYTMSELAAQFQVPVQLPASHDIAVPGNMRVHYRPRAAVKLVADFSTQPLPPQLVGVVYSQAAAQVLATAGVPTIQLPATAAGFRHGLYSALHEADSQRPQQILVEQPPQHDDWLDIWNRLLRASQA